MKKTAKKVSKKSTTVKKTRAKKEEKQKKSVAKVNVPQKEEKEKEEKKVLKSDYIQTIGRRKSAICQLRLIKDSKEKKFLINGKDAEKYFPEFENQKNVFAPLQKTNLTATKEIYIEAKVKGGGKKFGFKKEKEASSVIFPGLAIPHLVVEEKCAISLVIARSRKGVHFSTKFPPVHTIFVFVGSKETRTMYLRSLVAITEIAQQEDFREYWMKARDKKELRNIVLMGERKRIHLIYCLHCPEEVMFEDKVLCKIKCEDGEDCEPEKQNMEVCDPGM